MFKLYIFDMGGVVSHNTNVAPRISAYLDFNGVDIYELARDDFKALTTGAIAVPEFIRRFAVKCGRKVEEDLLTRFFHPQLDSDVVATIHGMKKKARVVVGTNTIAPHYSVHLHNGDYEAFDAVYASHLIGLAKPDRAFYTHVLEHEGCSPVETVFVDDLPVNVEAARQLGIRSLVFTDAEKLKEELAALKQPAV